MTGLTLLDRQLARFLATLATGDGVPATLLARLGQAWRAGQASLDLSDQPALRATLAQSPVVGQPGELRPLILAASGRLYLYRHWRAEQQVAAEMQARADVTVLAAPLGPAALTAALMQLLQAPAQGERPALGLAAPTIAAAQRLQQAARALYSQLPPEQQRRLPTDVQTLGQWLGLNAEGGRSRHHRANPLPLEALLVSEAETVALDELVPLLEALPLRARLLLLGDPAQCAAQPVFTALAAERATLPDLPVSIGPAVLRRALTAAVSERLVAAMQPYFATLSAGTDPAGAWAAFAGCGIICAQPDGPWGSAAVNRLLDSAFSPSGSLWYPGRPLRIVRSDRHLRLYRGDLGLVLPDPQVGQRLRVFFATLDGWRRLPPARVPPHETAYAVTVSDTQNLHFDRVIALLPETATLAQTVIYTIISRAATGVELWGDDPAAVSGDPP